MFQNLIERYGNRTAVIVDDGSSLTYNDLLEFSSKMKVRTKSRTLVFALCKNVPGSLLGYISFINNGIVPLMLEADLDKEMLLNLIQTYKPDYLWKPDTQADLPCSGEIVFSGCGYSLVSLRSDLHYKLYSDLAMLLTTSGSTGSPKLVRLSYNNMQANAISIAEYLHIDANERPVTTLPMSYSFGLSIINSHLLQGATLLLTSRTLMQREFWSFVKDQNATSMSGVPYTYEMLKKLRFFRMNLPSLKTLTQAGGKLNNELNQEFSEHSLKNGRKFYVMYGQTEATARMSYLPPEYSLKKLGSMGIAIPGGEFSLIDDSGKVITDSEVVGELVYTGKNVSLGYADCGNDLSRGDENMGRLVTGDMAKRDIDNFYYIVGRKKRFIKIFGNRVNLDETERMLKGIVSDCACTGKDDHLIIYVTEIGRVREVNDFIAAKTKINHIAYSVRHIAEIPKNSSGKTIYSSLPV